MKLNQINCTKRIFRNIFLPKQKRGESPNVVKLFESPMLVTFDVGDGKSLQTTLFLQPVYFGYNLLFQLKCVTYKSKAKNPATA